MCKNNKTTAIIKVTGNYCNLRCGYCFYQKEDQGAGTIMSLEFAENFIEQFLAMNQTSCTFIWHGGEPLLAGLNFFEHVVAFQEKYKRPNQNIHNGIQTNATLVSDAWATFFKQYGFGVGISLDGGEKSHNRFRVYPDGSGSFNDAMAGIYILKLHGIKPGYIQTVASDNLTDLEDNFKFFTEDLHATSWGMNYYLDHGCGVMSNQTVSPDEMANHVIKIIDLWLERNDRNLSIREIENFFRAILGKKTSDCDFSGTCGSFLSIDWNGGVYPCDRLSYMSEFKLGDMQSESLENILASPKFSLHKQRISTLPDKCNKCRWLIYCNNGCTYNRVNGMSGEYFFCEARKKIYTYSEKIYEKYCSYIRNKL